MRGPMHPMPATKLTYEDYLRLPDDGQRYEILDGRLVVSPSAGSSHQGIQAHLNFFFVGLIRRRRRGRVFGDLDCRLGNHDVVRPDLLVVLPQNEARITETHVSGTPDLVVEILSPSTANRDRTTKRRRYEAAGTPELWLVDGKRRTVTQYVHDGTCFGAPTVHTSTIRLAILPDVEIPLHEIW